MLLGMFFTIILKILSNLLLLLYLKVIGIKLFLSELTSTENSIESAAEIFSLGSTEKLTRPFEVVNDLV